VIASQGPRLARGVRLRRNADGEPLLLVPEGFLRLNATAVAIVQLIDGERDAGAITAALAKRFGVAPSVIAPDVDELLARLRKRAYVQ
jgi:pyrroloquinoline quinone biosynthesis protein D